MTTIEEERRDELEGHQSRLLYAYDHPDEWLTRDMVWRLHDPNPQ
jgi:hypothetical protein